MHRLRERFVSERTGIINQIRAFVFGIASKVRHGLHFLPAELPGMLATRTDALSSRMLHILEDLTRRLDARIEDLSSETKAFSSRPRLRTMAVPGIGSKPVRELAFGPKPEIWPNAKP